MTDACTVKRKKSTRAKLEGQVFGRLTVVEFSGIHKTHSVWRCRCECGGSVVAQARKLKSGMTRSCGCLRKEETSKRFTKHGHARTGAKAPEYNSWTAMRNRCCCSSHVAFKNYGGRGITICDRWIDDYLTFAADMGPRPTRRHTLDRIDVNGNYEPSNCRWATWEEQASNRREKH